MRADEGRGARGYPSWRAMAFSCGVHQDNMFRIDEATNAEAVAGILYHQLDQVFVEPADMQQLRARSSYRVVNCGQAAQRMM